jgi:hypothetical protein
VLPGGVGGLLLLKAARGGGQQLQGGGNRWVGKRRQRSCGHGQGGGDGHILKVVSTVQMWSARGSDRETYTRAHMVSLLTLNYPNRLNNKNQNGCLILLQNFPILASR